MTPKMVAVSSIAFARHVYDGPLRLAAEQVRSILEFGEDVVQVVVEDPASSPRRDP